METNNAPAPENAPYENKNTYCPLACSLLLLLLYYIYSIAIFFVTCERRKLNELQTARYIVVITIYYHG